jgi:hypothetical protein
VPKKTRVVNYQGKASKVYPNYQKIVERYTKEEVAQGATIPQSIKDVSADPNSPSKKTVIEVKEVKWEITDYADKTARSYLKRTDPNAYKRDV